MIHLQDIVTFSPNSVTADCKDYANLRTEIEWLAPDATY